MQIKDGDLEPKLAFAKLHTNLGVLDRVECDNFHPLGKRNPVSTWTEHSIAYNTMKEQMPYLLFLVRNLHSFETCGFLEAILYE